MNIGKRIAAVVGLAVLNGAAVRAEDWPKLSGTHSNWTSDDRGLADAWPKEGPKTVWAVTNLGGGFGSPVVAGERVFLIGRPLDPDKKDKNGNYPNWDTVKCLPGPDVLTCLYRSTGTILWKHEFNSTTNPASTAWNTPTVNGDVMYARGGDGQVRCISIKDGKSLWAWPSDGEVPFADKNSWLCGRVATAASVTLCDDLLIMVAGQGRKQNILVGINKKTGKKVWEQPFSDWMHIARRGVISAVGAMTP